MSIEFDVRLNAEDMYRFNMYHAYTSMQGLLSLALGIIIICIIAFSEDFNDPMTAMPYVLLALLFFLYIPLTLRIRSKRQIRTSEVLRGPLHYEFVDDGIRVVAPDGEDALLGWDYIYKAVTTKRQLLIYSNRINAYVIPREQIEAQLPEVCAALQEHCEAYRLHLKAVKA